MAITVGTRLEGNDTNAGSASSVTTATVDFGADTIVVGFIGLTAGNAVIPAPTCSGAKGSWATYSSAGEFLRLQATTSRSMWLVIGTGASTNEAITITLGSSPVITGVTWIFTPVSGANLTTPVPTGQVAVSHDPMNTDWDLAEAFTATLPSAPPSTSKLFAAACIGVTSDTLVQGSGLTELAVEANSTPSLGQHVSWTAGTVQQSASYTQTSGNNAVGGVMCVEVQEPAAVGSLVIPPARYQHMMIR